MSRGHKAALVVLWLVLILICVNVGGLDTIGGYEDRSIRSTDTRATDMTDTPCDEADQPGNEHTPGWRWCKGETGLLSLVPALRSFLTPCPGEDSSSCYWDAARRGDGRGLSFVAWPYPKGGTCYTNVNTTICYAD